MKFFYLSKQMQLAVWGKKATIVQLLVLATDIALGFYTWTTYGFWIAFACTFVFSLAISAALLPWYISQLNLDKAQDAAEAAKKETNDNDT